MNCKTSVALAITVALAAAVGVSSSASARSAWAEANLQQEQQFINEEEIKQSIEEPLGFCYPVPPPGCWYCIGYGQFCFL